MIAALVVVALCGAGPADWTTDAAGRELRIGFDPGSRFVLGGAWDYEARDEAHRLQLEVAWYLRDDDHDDDVRWKLTHTFAGFAATFGDGVAIDALLYRGEFLRWSRDGKITLPTTPPTRIGFPVDIGLSVELARLRTRPASDTWKSDIRAVAAELMFDFWRSPVSGSYLVLAFGAEYDLWVGREGRPSEVLHVVAPFSHARLTLHHEWCQGKQLLEATVDAMTAWTSAETWAEHVGAQLSYEWTFLAIDDRPLSLRLAGQWRWDELSDVGRDDGHELRATAGLRLGL